MADSKSGPDHFFPKHACRAFNFFDFLAIISMQCDAERVDKFHADALKLCADGKAAKVMAEMHRLRTWLTKHQDESLADAGKQKLVACIEVYFKFAQALDATFETPIGEAAQGLITDLLKLPPGKLVNNSGGKSKALKWLAATQQSSSAASASASAASASSSAWTVADVSPHDCTLTLTSGGFDDDDNDDNDEIRDAFPVADRTLFERVRRCIDSGGAVEVELKGDVIVNTRFRDEQ